MELNNMEEPVVVTTRYGKYLLIEGTDAEGTQFILFTKRFGARRPGENLAAKETAL
jgi:hypothetical protein